MNYVENIGSSTMKVNNIDYQSVKSIRKFMTDELRTQAHQGVNFVKMKNIKLYTEPVIKRGKDLSKSFSGITLKKEQAKLDWYIEFYIKDNNSNTQRRKKIREGLNYIKDFKEKEIEANRMLQDVIELLQQGWNPFDQIANQSLLQEVISLNIADALELFIIHNIEIGTRKKSISSYKSKLKLFGEFYPDIKVKELTELHIEKFLNTKHKQLQWQARTFNAAKTILGIFFNFLIKKRYITEQLTHHISGKKVMPVSEKHSPISDEHFALVKDYLKAHDRLIYFFIMVIHYTCIRPIELRGLKIGMINLKTNTITIPSTLSKNGLSLPVEIDPDLRQMLIDLKFETYPNDYYIFSLSSEIIGEFPLGTNTPYNRFTKCLKALKLDNLNYTLYSIKHRTNIQRHLAGWSIQQLMKANRHSSPSQTETYLRDLKLFVNLSGLKVPSF